MTQMCTRHADAVAALDVMALRAVTLFSGADAASCRAVDMPCSNVRRSALRGAR